MNIIHRIKRKGAVQAKAVLSRINPCFQLVEQFSVVAAVEPPFALLQKQVEALFRDAIEAPQMPLRLVSEVLDPVDVVSLIGEQFGMVDPHMVEGGNIQGVIA